MLTSRMSRLRIRAIPTRTTIKPTSKKPLNLVPNPMTTMRRKKTLRRARKRRRLPLHPKRPRSRLRSQFSHSHSPVISMVEITVVSISTKRPTLTRETPSIRRSRLIRLCTTASWKSLKIQTTLQMLFRQLVPSTPKSGKPISRGLIRN